MSKWFLIAANKLISFGVSLFLLTAILYAGYALWDNQQIYASADNQLSDIASSTSMAEAARDAGSEMQGKASAASGSGTDETSGHGTEDQGRENNAGTDTTVTTAGETEEEETELSKLFKKLKAVNDDIGAWITMPGTAIDYAVVRGNSNIDYISKDVYGNFSIAGSVFLDFRNREDYSDTYNLLYGHNMSEHRMFSDVNLYKEENFFNENQKGYIYFPTGAHWLQSISIILTNSSDSWAFNPSVWTDLEGEEMVERVQQNALFVSETGMEALEKKIESGERPQLVALSTCSSEFTDARTILLTLMDP